MAAEFGRLPVLCFTLVLSGGLGLWLAFPEARAETAEMNSPGPMVAASPDLGASGTINLAANLPRGVKSSREAQAMELAFWDAIKNSKNPEDYQAYLEAFPNGAFVPLAQARIRQYSKKVEPAAPKVSEPAPAKPAVVPEPEPPKQAQPAGPAIRAVEGRFVAASNANVRTRPSPSARRMATVNSGSQVEVTGQVVGQDWYQIKTRDGRVGFVYGPLLSKVGQTPSVAKKPAPQAPQAEAPQVAAKQPRVFRDCSSCPEMVELSSGRFVMGTNGGDIVEAPTRRVSIGAFAIGRYEVTMAQWMACVTAGGCSYKPKSNGNPERMAVRNISWNDTQDYLRWLRKVTGKSYRLPSEAEWEFATRAGSSRSYWWGDRPEAKKAGCKDCGGPWSRKAPREIGSFPSNAFGLHDVSGGVAEWTADCWYANYRGAPNNGSARNRADCNQRVLRGGAWRHTTSYLRSAARLPYDADVRYLAHGFRVAAPLN